jgi:NAD(P)H-flavin reductase
MTQSWAMNAKGQIEIQVSHNLNGKVTKQVSVYEKQPESRD